MSKKRSAQIPASALRQAVVATHAELNKGPHQRVLAVAAGYRLKRGAPTAEPVVTLFVEQKLNPQQLREQGVMSLPTRVDVMSGRKRYSVATDVVEFASSKGAAQSLDPCAPLSKSQHGGSAGVVSWLNIDGTVCGFTAEHVVGFGSVDAPLFSQGRTIGHVTKCGYALTNVDAVLFELEAGEVPSTTLAGRVLEAPRAVRLSDVGGAAAHVYVPHSGLLKDVAIHFIHLQGFSLTSPDGTIFQPRPLVLTDMCTAAGDSGTLLLGSDFRPLGLLSGIVTANDGRSHSCFTELASVLDTLL